MSNYERWFCKFPANTTANNADSKQFGFLLVSLSSLQIQPANGISNFLNGMDGVNDDVLLASRATPQAISRSGLRFSINRGYRKMSPLVGAVMSTPGGVGQQMNV